MTPKTFSRNAHFCCEAFAHVLAKPEVADLRTDALAMAIIGARTAGFETEGAASGMQTQF
jgi:hypothetical protein